MRAPLLGVFLLFTGGRGWARFMEMDQMIAHLRVLNGSISDRFCFARISRNHWKAVAIREAI